MEPDRRSEDLELTQMQLILGRNTSNRSTFVIIVVIVVAISIRIVKECVIVMPRVNRSRLRTVINNRIQRRS